MKEQVAHKNALRALKRKVIRTPLAETLHETAITQLNENARTIEEEIGNLINQDPDFRDMIKLLTSMTGVGMLLATYMLVIVKSAPQPLSAKVLAAFIGICLMNTAVVVLFVETLHRAIMVHRQYENFFTWLLVQHELTMINTDDISIARWLRANQNNWSSTT